MTRHLRELLDEVKQTDMAIFTDNWEITTFNMGKDILKTFIDHKNVLSLNFNLRVYEEDGIDYKNVPRLSIEFQDDPKNKHKLEYIRKMHNIKTKINQNFINLEFTNMTNLYRAHKTDNLVFTARDSDGIFKSTIYKQLNSLMGSKFDKLFSYYHLESKIPQSHTIRINKIKI